MCSARRSGGCRIATTTRRRFRAEFRQTVESPTLAGVLESHGKVAFEKPNRMRWDYEPPDRQTIVGDGQTLWLYQPDQQQVIKAPLSEAFEASTPVTFLAGLGHVDREFEATLDKDEPERWVLKLVPRKERQIRHVDAERPQDRRVGRGGEGDRHPRHRHPDHFTGEQANSPIEPALFRFTPPPGVDVVKPPTS